MQETYPFCLAAYIRILKPVLNRSLKEITELLLECINIKDQGRLNEEGLINPIATYSIANYNKIHAGKQGLPEFYQLYRLVGMDYVKQYFEKKVVPLVNPKEKNVLIYGLRNLILEDCSIPETTEIELFSSWTKSDIRNEISFHLSRFLASLFIFSLQQDNQKTLPEDIKNSTYLAQFQDKARSITVYTTDKVVRKAPIPLSTNNASFKDSWTLVKSENLGFQKAENFEIYALPFCDAEFDYQSLEQAIYKNLGNCLWSRTEVADYDLSLLGFKGWKLLTSFLAENPAWNSRVLDGIILYLFLEAYLGAPKLMSQIEVLKNYETAKAGPVSVHLLDLVAPTQKKQLIIGASFIHNNFDQAVNEVFSQINSYIKGNRNGRYFSDPAIFRGYVDSESYLSLKQALVPEKQSKSNHLETAFGAFIGYKVPDVNSAGLSIEEKQKAILEAIKEESDKIADHVRDCIRSNRLENYSFYIYLLPFSNADADKLEIVELLMKGDAL